LSEEKYVQLTKITLKKIPVTDVVLLIEKKTDYKEIITVTKVWEEHKAKTNNGDLCAARVLKKNSVKTEPVCGRADVGKFCANFWPFYIC
jgi:hypothetical protein